MSRHNVDTACSIINLQKDPKYVRNICILAHVDHGKTTLADSLISFSGIFSKRLAGKLRYMDYRPDEQERGITLKSSSISLRYSKQNSNQDYLINLIDTPGHVDFSFEVSTAVRLCEGAIVLVDAVEGVCPQTRACLQQVHKEYLKPILIINKIDRLILEKKFTPSDAYLHLTQLLEQVNAVVGSIFACDVMSKEDLSEQANYTSALESSDDSTLYFSPEKQNVLFCSAIDGWAFSVEDFAKMYSKKLNISAIELSRVFWGDYYFSTKKMCPILGAQKQAKKPMFVQFILENIWNLYDIICIQKNFEKITDIAGKLEINISPRDLKSPDVRSQLRTLFSQWLPIHTAVMEAVIDIIPDPKGMDAQRAEHFLCPNNLDFLSYPKETQILKEHFMLCDSNSPTVIAYISKMICFDRRNLPKNKSKCLTTDEIRQRRELIKQKMKEQMQQVENCEMKEDMKNLSLDKTVAKAEHTEEEGDQVLIAFVRIFSGTIKPGMKLYVLSPKYDPRKQNLQPIHSLHMTEIKINELYLFIGGELHSLPEVPAGNIFGVGGLQDIVMKTATLSNNIYCPSFSELSITAQPILKVAVEPVNISEMPALLRGLKLLNQADACVQVSIQESGEHTITTLGEVHLEKCIKDLEEIYAKVKMNVSTPIVSFRETIVPIASVDMVNETIIKVKNAIHDQVITIQTANKLGHIKVIALPLSVEAVKCLEKNVDTLKLWAITSKNNELSEKLTVQLSHLKKYLSKELKKLALEHLSTEKDLIDKVWSIGPKKCGSNVLINLSDYTSEPFWTTNYNPICTEHSDVRTDFNNSFISGFQFATSAGPLCEEPMQGVAFVVLEWSINNSEDINSKVFGPFSGQVISAVKDACRKAFQVQPQRLVSPMYTCNIIVNSEVLGKMYSVIARRHGRILTSDLTQGSDNFAISAIIPVIESLNFAQEIRKQTSGLACPQLIFSHWEIIDIDPFWTPSTEEEYLHFGEKGDSINRAKQYMDAVRRRKGLAVEEKIVEHGEKQRTLSKKK